MSNADEILKLKELLDKGIISNDEFEKKKNGLLGKKLSQPIQQQINNVSYINSSTNANLR